MTTTDQDTAGAELGRYVFVTRPRCPECNSAELRAYKTIKSEDGLVVTRYTLCLKCRHRFLTISE